MKDKPTFGRFLRRAWWLILIAVSIGFPAAHAENLTGSVAGDVLAAVAVPIVPLFIYWAVKYR